MPSVLTGCASRKPSEKAAVAAAAVAPAAVAQSTQTLKVGLIGCGGRGSGAASQALNADPNVVLTAMGDAFEDQLQKSLQSLQKEHADKVKVTPEKCFVGLDAYQKVIDSGVDVVLLATPPGFRPVHLKAAVDAGKHIFCEKPMATDAPGVRSVLESVKAAKEKNLSLVAGFCWRYETARREFYQRIHDGAIGDIRAIYATYYAGPVKPMPPASERPAGDGRSGMADAQLVQLHLALGRRLRRAGLPQRGQGRLGPEGPVAAQGRGRGRTPDAQQPGQHLRPHVRGL